MSGRVGIVRFPGTNCDRDVMGMVTAKGFKPEYLWHLDLFESKKYQMLILPGGFSYGDYLRSGALAARSPVMKSVKEFAALGGPVLGICNGFQILCEAEILPGVLLKNNHQRFNDKWVELKLESREGPFLKKNKKAQIRLPVAHGDGRYFAPPDQLKLIEDSGQVWMRYEKNPNGSEKNIAGILSAKKNVAALMPHPERALYEWMGGVDGWGFL